MKDRPHPLLRKLISLLIENVLYHPESDQQQASREVYQAAEINRTSLPYAKRLSGRRKCFHNLEGIISTVIPRLMLTTQP